MLEETYADRHELLKFIQASGHTKRKTTWKISSDAANFPGV